MRKMPVLCVILAVVASACGSAPGSGKQGKALAVVNGEPLTEATLLKEVEILPPYVRPILETAAGRAQFLESVITRDLLMREALRRGIDRRPEVADRIAMARKSIVLEALLRDVAEKAPGLSDAALRKIYDANPASHQVGERVKVSHILFREKARALEMLGALSHLMPELLAMQGVEQSPPHVYDVWTHTLAVLYHLDQVISGLRVGYDADKTNDMFTGLLGLRLGRFREQIAQHFAQPLNVDRSYR